MQGKCVKLQMQVESLSLKDHEKNYNPYVAEHGPLNTLTSI